MTVISKVELIDTWLLIWIGGYERRTGAAGFMLLLFQFGFALAYATATLTAICLGLPEAEQFATDAVLTFGVQLFIGLAIMSIKFTRQRNYRTEAQVFLRRLSLSSAFTLPTLVSLHYGIYALLLVAWPTAALITEVLLKERVSRESTAIALLGCAMVLVVAQ